MGLPRIWRRRLSGGAEQGGRAVSFRGRVSRVRFAPQRGAAGGRPARLAGTSCCRGIGAGPSRFAPFQARPAGQAIIDRLPVHPPFDRLSGHPPLRRRYVRAICR
jgi:hypothetical protein